MTNYSIKKKLNLYKFLVKYYFYFKKNYLKIFIIYSTVFFIFTINIFNDEHKWLDSLEYVKRAELINFFPLNLEGLEDAFRPPLFPIILKFIGFIPFNVTIMAKILNVIAIVSMPFILFKISQNNSSEFFKKICFININILLFFFPNFYFLDLVYAETLTIVIFNIYTFYLVGFFYDKKFFNKNNFRLILLFFLILFYLKANMILLSLSFILILFLKQKKNYIFFLKLCLLSGMFIAPWFIYTFKITSEVKVTTSQHVNRLQGMGLDIIYQQNLDTIHGKYLYNAYKNNEFISEAFKLYRSEINENEIIKNNQGISKEFQLKREGLSKISIERIWNYDKVIQIKYSFLKITHLFGLNFRDHQDYLFFSFFCLIFLSIFYLRKSRSNVRPILYYNALILFSLIIQTLLYVPTLRYSIYFANSSIMILSATLYIFLRKNN